MTSLELQEKNPQKQETAAEKVIFQSQRAFVVCADEETEWTVSGQKKQENGLKIFNSGLF